MREKIILYGEESTEELFGKGYEKSVSMFEPMPKHTLYAKVSSSPCGYVAYGRYIIPILLAIEDMDMIKHDKDSVEYIIKNIDTVTGIGFECFDKSCYGNIIIGEAVFYSLNYEELIPILYHEIGHLIAPGFMLEADADRFAVAHVGSTRLLDALGSLEMFRSSFRENIARSIASVIDAIDYKVSQLMGITLSEDSSLCLYRVEYIKKCKYIRGLPVMSLYLNENIIKEYKKGEN